MNCCGPDMKSWCDTMNCKVEETDDGVKVEITPKDKSKKESLKSFMKSCKDLFDCKC